MRNLLCNVETSPSIGACFNEIREISQNSILSEKNTKEPIMSDNQRKEEIVNFLKKCNIVLN